MFVEIPDPEVILGVILPVFVVFTMLPSQKGMNKYGLQPSKIDRSVFSGPGLGKLLNLW